MSKDTAVTEGATTEAPAKNNKKKSQYSYKSAIMGIMLAAVFLSITISAALLLIGSQYNKVFIVIVTPMVGFAVFLLALAFAKILK